MSMPVQERLKLHVAVWGVGGIALTFIESIARLGHRGLRAVEAGLTGPQWLALIIATVLLSYVEGYRALQRRFAPDVVARALELAAHPSVARGLLAPLYVTSLVGSSREALARAWLAVVAIATVVMVVRLLPDPWRGVVDFAVATALAWGLVALLLRFSDAVRLVANPQPRDPVVTEIRS